MSKKNGKRTVKPAGNRNAAFHPGAVKTIELEGIVSTYKAEKIKEYAALLSDYEKKVVLLVFTESQMASLKIASAIYEHGSVEKYIANAALSSANSDNEDLACRIRNGSIILKEVEAP